MRPKPCVHHFKTENGNSEFKKHVLIHLHRRRPLRKVEEFIKFGASAKKIIENDMVQALWLGHITFYLCERNEGFHQLVIACIGVDQYFPPRRMNIDVEDLFSYNKTAARYVQKIAKEIRKDIKKLWRRWWKYVVVFHVMVWRKWTLEIINTKLLFTTSSSDRFRSFPMTSVMSNSATKQRFWLSNITEERKLGMYSRCQLMRNWWATLGYTSKI